MKGYIGGVPSSMFDIEPTERILLGKSGRKLTCVRDLDLDYGLAYIGVADLKNPHFFFEAMLRDEVLTLQYVTELPRYINKWPIPFTVRQHPDIDPALLLLASVMSLQKARLTVPRIHLSYQPNERKEYFKARNQGMSPEEAATVTSIGAIVVSMLGFSTVSVYENLEKGIYQEVSVSFIDPTCE